MATHLRRGLEFTRELCVALGMDPDKDHVRSITIHSSVNEAVAATVERFVTTDEGARIVEIARKYSVEPRSIEDEPDPCR
jgi:hypothetical protein